MTNFIEITTLEGQKELINTNVIELVHVHESETIIRYSTNSASGFVTLTVKDSYDDIKNQLLQ